MSDTAPVFLITPRGRFELKRGETLLAALERTGHTVEYQCRSGYCGSCRLQLAEPQQAQHLFYPNPPLAHVSETQVLPCCCQSRGTISLQLPQRD